MNKRILVTGSSGMIGTAFCEKLLEKRITFVGVDKIRNQWNPSIDAATLIKDLTEEFQFGYGSYDTVVHLAANARVFDLVENPDLARENMVMTYNVLEFTRKNGIKEFIYASSREVYGNSFVCRTCYNEDSVDLELCESPYTASKILGEALVHAYRRCYGINSIIVRFSNVYGRYDYNDRVIPLFIAKAIKNYPLEVFGENKVLDFTYIDDAVDGLYKAAVSFKKARNRVYNLAYGEGYSITKVASEIIEKLGSRSIINHKKSRIGEVEEFVADIDRARIKFGYKPKYDLDEGLDKTIEWYKPRVEEYLKQIRR